MFMTIKLINFRLGQQLNVAYERTPEHLFYDALCKAESFTKMPRIEEYTATESMALENLTGTKSFWMGNGSYWKKINS